MACSNADEFTGAGFIRKLLDLDPTERERVCDFAFSFFYKTLFYRNVIRRNHRNPIEVEKIPNDKGEMIGYKNPLKRTEAEYNALLKDFSSLVQRLKSFLILSQKGTLQRLRSLETKTD